MAQYTLAAINGLDRAGFVAALGGIFEHSPWVAERAWAARPFADIGALHAAMVAVVQRAAAAEQLALIRAHPDLGTRLGRAALSANSASEQAGVGLDRLTDEEFARFQSLNSAYRQRFGFPFIITVRHHTREGIVSAFERRLRHDAEAERAAALVEIGEIARYRLLDTIA